MSETTTATLGGPEVIPHPDVIQSSRLRSREFGLSQNEAPDFSVVSSAQMNALLEQNRLLYAHALPVMETLYDQIINTHSMVVLTNSQGLILHALGDDDFLEKANRVALRPGVTWSEQSKGTNAIGTALAEGQPVLVHAAEHFLNVNHFLTCSCAPIIDPYGNVVGALDVTGDHSSYHKHTMALVRMSAQMIENHLFSSVFPEAVRIHFHSRPEFLGTLVEGIAAFSAAGRFLSANRSAQFQLGLPVKALQAHTFSSLFGMPMSALFDHYRASNPGHLSLCLHNGVSIRARAEFRAPATIFGPTQTASQTISKEAAAVHGPAPSAQRHRQGLSSLRYLNTGDPQIAAVISKVTKVQGRDIPILILGETGTGKEILAQAIHNDSTRRQGPFVAVNCASIPETLIESELFGYEEGAFTGARKKGGVGKILQANGGTLFLDEIGDMPLTLQARLLRVLQERTVTPLGSTKFIPVNLSLICATNRNLRELMAAGTFREDLYYRLNGLVVKLPPLRERTDLETVVEKLLVAECECRKPLTVSTEVMRMFRQYHWPGNFRQLTNLLRTACVMAADDDVIDTAHMPDDFLEDLREAGESMRRTPAGTSGGTSAGARGTDDEPHADTVLSALGTRLEDVELSAITEALRRHGGNVSAAARALNVSRNTIYRKMAAAERVRQTAPA